MYHSLFVELNQTTEILVEVNDLETSEKSWQKTHFKHLYCTLTSAVFKAHQPVYHPKKNQKTVHLLLSWFLVDHMGVYSSTNRTHLSRESL